MERATRAASLARPRFTALVLLTIVAAAWWTGSLERPLDPELREAWGFSPLHLAHGRLERLVTGAPLTGGGSAFWSAAALVVFAVGAAELFAGTRRAALAFLVAHVASRLVCAAGVLLLLRNGEREVLVALAAVFAVGPSAGALGCLGLLCTRPRRFPALALVAAGALGLAGRLAWIWARPDPPAERLDAAAAGLIGFLAGAALGWILHRGDRLRRGA